MPLFAARTRYSLVKGERIVRFVLTAWLRDLFTERLGVLYLPYYTTLSCLSHVGQKAKLVELLLCGQLAVAVCACTKRGLPSNPVDFGLSWVVNLLFQLSDRQTGIVKSGRLRTSPTMCCSIFHPCLHVHTWIVTMLFSSKFFGRISTTFVYVIVCLVCTYNKINVICIFFLTWMVKITIEFWMG